MITPRHRVKFEKVDSIYNIKVIDSEDDEVQWGQAVHQRGSRQWFITRDGSNNAMTIEAGNVDEARAQLERMLDASARGGSK